MATDVIKCTGCNIVINELLAFVRNKLDVMDEISISQICRSAFSVDEITSAKKLLFESLPTEKRNITRKGDRKNLRDIEDIISLMKQTNPDLIPIFVARDLQKLPPISFDHVDVTRLLKDNLLLKEEVRCIREQYVTLEMFNSLKYEVNDLRNASLLNNLENNVNTKRRAYLRGDYNLDSGPMGLQHLQSKSILEQSCISINSVDQQITSSPLQHLNRQYRQIDSNEILNSKGRVSEGERDTRSANHVADIDTADLVDALSFSPMSQNKGARAKQPMQRGEELARSKTQLSNSAHSEQRLLQTDKSVHLQSPTVIQKPPKTAAEILREPGEWKQIGPDGEWKIVQRKRLRNRIVGKMGNAAPEPNGKFKAAEIKIPLFIYNIDKSVTEEDICNHIYNKSQSHVPVQKLNMKLDRGYSAFKVMVPKHKIDLFLSEHFWPDGVLFRRFVDFSKHKGQNSGSPDKVSNTKQNGL